MEDPDDNKFSRCIICRDYTVKKQCFNIFNTTLDKGQVLLSDFVKNVLDCSVLIVVTPEFFLCKRCFSLCNELDFTLARCNELQLTIQTLFKEAKKNDSSKNFEESTVVKTEIVHEDGEFWEPDQDNLYYEAQSMKGETVEVQSFLDSVIIDNETVPFEDDLLEEIQEESCTDDYAEDQTTLNNVSTGEEVDPVRSETPTEPQIWTCKACKISFDNEELLRSHKITEVCKMPTKKPGIKSSVEFKNYSVKLKKKAKVFFCNHCTYETPISGNMEKHLITHKSDPLFMCDVCGKRFKYFKTFKTHQLVHDESRPFGCKLCPFRAMTELKLRIHERLHDDQKKYSCSKCGYKTLKKMSYIIHCRTHTGERPYCCPNCPYKAKDPSTLLRHRRIHGGLKRYHCSICDYKALQKGALTIHMRTHTGEKPHACSQCDYRSATKHNLDSHFAAIHSSEKPYACTVCSYKTKVKRLLTYHLKSHSDEKPYACMLCDYRVRYRQALRYHMRKKHPLNQSYPQPNHPLTECEAKRLHFQGEDVEFSDDVGSDSEGC